MALLYADEDLSREFVDMLDGRGHDVIYAVDTGATARTDAWHLQQAAIQGRTLITFNERDFRYLHRLWTSLRIFEVMARKHAGILTATAQLEPSAWLPTLEELLITESDLSGRMLVWSPTKAEWREDAWRPEE